MKPGSRRNWSAEARAPLDLVLIIAGVSHGDLRRDERTSGYPWSILQEERPSGATFLGFIGAEGPSDRPADSGLQPPVWSLSAEDFDIIHDVTPTGS